MPAPALSAGLPADLGFDGLGLTVPEDRGRGFVQHPRQDLRLLALTEPAPERAHPLRRVVLPINLRQSPLQMVETPDSLALPHG
jgi:hypothetical protein